MLFEQISIKKKVKRLQGTSEQFPQIYNLNESKIKFNETPKIGRLITGPILNI